MTEKDTIKFIRMVVSEHEDIWEQKSSELLKYKEAYSNRFWQAGAHEDSMIRIETSDGFSYIEGYIASLFSKSPAVEIGLDEALQGDVELAKAVTNRFLYNQRRHFEDGSRQALIYPSAFFKLAARESTNILDKVSIKACPGWEIICDRDAASWEEQRYTGHIYYITIPVAKDRFGPKDYTAVKKVDYFKGLERVSGKDVALDSLPEQYLYIKVVELYDLINDKLYFWSPNYSQGDKLLDKDIIPIRTYDDRPLPPISPLYYARVPDKPLDGMSAMARVYDQIYEKNILRTYWANAVRRDSRQYLYKEGKLDEEQLAKITAGIDGAMIGVDEESLAGLIQEVGVTPISSNFDRYAGYIEADINRGSILAPFTRGEATNATATEITALAQYTASEIGKMARDRDEAIEKVANIYIRILSFLAEDGDKAVIFSNGRAKVVSPKDLNGKFKIAAVDQGSSPLSDSIRKQNLIELLPILTSLGVPPHKIREQIIHAFELPESFLEDEAESKAREDAKAAAEEAAAAKKIGPRSIPGDLATGNEQASTPGDLASALIGSAQTQGLE